MFRSVLIGYDRSARGDDAIALGGLLARACGARVAIGCVFSRPALTEEDDPIARDLRERTVRVAAVAAAEMRGFGAQSHAVEDSSPALGLQRLATYFAADLVVVGSSHRGVIGRVFAGSVPEQLAHAARFAVAVPPRGYAKRTDRRLDRVGVGFDGSRESRIAVEQAAGLARATGAHLEVIGVGGAHVAFLAGSPFAAAQSAEYAARIRRHEEQLVRRVADTMENVDVTAEPALGTAAGALAARSADLDLLVLGSRAYGVMRRIVSGSTSTKLIRDAACPLLVLPRLRVPDEAEAEPARSAERRR